MKQGWEKKKLGEVCEFKSGTTIDSKLEKSDGKIIYAKVGDMNIEGNEDSITMSSRYVDLKSINQNQIIPVGSIIFPKRGGAIATNKKRRIIQPTIVDLNIMALVPRKVIDKDYLFYWFQQIDLSGLSNGTSIPQINNYSFDDVYITYPKPLPEQQRIVAILDEAFAAIAQAKANAEQNLKNAKELFESYLQVVFENKGDGWKHTRLGEICQINDGTHFSPKNSSSGDFMYITAKNIKPYFIDLSNITYISEKDHKEIYSRCSPVKGDVLYIKDGATAGIATINTIEEDFSMLSSVALLKCSEKILNTFLVYYMNSSVGKKNFLGYVDGAAITRLTLIKIKNVCFSLPQISEQQTIVLQLDALRTETQKLEAIYQKKIDDLEELKKSILKKAFAGELTTEKAIAV